MSLFNLFNHSKEIVEAEELLTSAKNDLASLNQDIAEVEKAKQELSQSVSETFKTYREQLDDSHEKLKSDLHQAVDNLSHELFLFVDFMTEIKVLNRLKQPIKFAEMESFQKLPQVIQQKLLTEFKYLES